MEEGEGGCGVEGCKGEGGVRDNRGLTTPPRSTNIHRVDAIVAACKNLYSRREAKLLVVAPQHRRPGLDLCFAEDVVEVWDLVFATITDKHDKGACTRLDAILDQRAHTRIDLLARHGVLVERLTGGKDVF